MTKEYGEAYGFFYCDTGKEAIERELPTIRELAQTPSEIEIKLIDDIKGFSKGIKDDEELRNLSQEALKSGINYVLHAKCPNATNERTASEVGDILNQAYQSPLYKKDEEFRGDVVYKEKGRYLFKE